MSKSHTHHQVTDDVDLPTLGRALWRAKGWIIGLAIGAAVVTFIGLSMVRPLYTSEARILIQNDESAFTRPTNDQGRDPQQRVLDEQAVQSQVQVLTSRDLAVQVIKDLNLINNPEFQKDAGVTLIKRFLNRIGLGRGSPKSEEEKAANAFAEHLSVFQLSRSSVIAVQYTSGDTSLAAQVANKLADVYIDWQRTAKLEQTKDATAWLSAQIEVLRKRVTESEEAAEQFRASKGLYAGSNNVTLSAQQLSELNSQLILSAAQKSEAEARARLIKKMLADKGDIDATPEVLKSELVGRLIEQRVQVQRQLAELSATLLPSHPRIKQLTSELADVRQQIRAEAEKIAKGLENEAAVASARENSLRNSLNELKSQASGLSDAEIKLRALEREAKANRDLLESYLARYRDASARHDMGAVPAQAAIVSRGHASILPSFPKRGPITLLVMAATALLALAYVLARELIGETAPAREPVRTNDSRMRARRPQHIPAAAQAQPAKPQTSSPPAAARPQSSSMAPAKAQASPLAKPSSSPTAPAATLKPSTALAPTSLTAKSEAATPSPLAAKKSESETWIPFAAKPKTEATAEAKTEVAAKAKAEVPTAAAEAKPQAPAAPAADRKSEAPSAPAAKAKTETPSAPAATAKAKTEAPPTPAPAAAPKAATETPSASPSKAKAEAPSVPAAKSKPEPASAASRSQGTPQVTHQVTPAKDEPAVASKPRPGEAAGSPAGSQAPSFEPVKEGPSAGELPAAAGLLERLRRGLAQGDGAASPATTPASGMLGRFRRTGTAAEAAEENQVGAKAASVETAPLGSNDLRHYLNQRIAAAGRDLASDTSDVEIAAKPKAGTSRTGPALNSLDAVLEEVLTAAKGGPPRALLVAGVSPKTDATRAAIGLARALVAKGERVVLLDVTRGPSAVSGPLGLPRAPGYTDLAANRASFGEVLRIDDETPLQVIAAGNPTVESEGKEAERFARVFEALTQTYDCVVLHADRDMVRRLAPALKFELPTMVAVLPQGGSPGDATDELAAFSGLGCPIVIYEQNGKEARSGLLGRVAAI